MPQFLAASTLRQAPLVKFRPLLKFDYALIIDFARYPCSGMFVTVHGLGIDPFSRKHNDFPTTTTSNQVEQLKIVVHPENGSIPVSCQ